MSFEGTVVWINHDIRQVSELADHVTYVDRRVLLDGPPKAVLLSGTAQKLFPTLSFTQADNQIDSTEATQ